MKRVVITGLYAACSCGKTLKEIFNNCIDQVTGVKYSQSFDNMGISQYPIGKIITPKDDFAKDQIEEKTHKLMKKAIRGALSDASMVESKVNNPYQTGISIASSTLKVLKMEEYTRRKINNQDLLAGLVMGDSFIHNICAEFGISGETYNTSTACASSTIALGVAYDAICYGETKCMIMASADPLTETSMSGFHILRTLTQDVCRPLDINRNGINLGEANVAFILEDYDEAIKRNSKIYAEILGYGIGNDAHSATAPDPNGSGAKYVMNEAIVSSSIDKHDIGYINIHGTGTVLNDLMETKALSDLQLDGYISSTKSMTGHCIATAGAIELAISIIIGKEKVVPPTYNLQNAIQTEYPLQIVCNKPVELKSPYIISNSFGFGGNSASILIKIV